MRKDTRSPKQEQSVAPQNRHWSNKNLKKNILDDNNFSSVFVVSSERQVVRSERPFHRNVGNSQRDRKKSRSKTKSPTINVNLSLRLIQTDCETEFGRNVYSLRYLNVSVYFISNVPLYFIQSQVFPVPLQCDLTRDASGVQFFV